MVCPHCDSETVTGQIYCQSCGIRLVSKDDTVGRTIRDNTPWENRERIGFLQGMLETLKTVLFSPNDFFRRMTVIGGLGEPLLYALIVGMIGMMFFFSWDTLFFNSLGNDVMNDLNTVNFRNSLPTQGQLLIAVLTPFFMIGYVFVQSGWLHLLLHVIRSAHSGFESTFRVVSYSMSSFVFLTVPGCGMTITVLWIITLTIIGLKQTQNISTGKAAIVVLFPLFSGAVILLMALVLLMIAIAASLGAIIQLYQ